MSYAGARSRQVRPRHGKLSMADQYAGSPDHHNASSMTRAVPCLALSQMYGKRLVPTYQSTLEVPICTACKDWLARYQRHRECMPNSTPARRSNQCCVTAAIFRHNALECSLSDLMLDMTDTISIATTLTSFEVLLHQPWYRILAVAPT